jgi:hypothetical protein
MWNAGGIVGSNQVGFTNNQGVFIISVDVSSYVNNCYNRATVGVTPAYGDANPSNPNIPGTAALFAGGIIGFQAGSAQNVYNIGSISVLSPPSIPAPPPPPPTTPPAITPAVGQIIGQYTPDTRLNPGTGANLSPVNSNYFIKSGGTPAGAVGLVTAGSPPAAVTFDSTGATPGPSTLLDDLNAWVDFQDEYSEWSIVAGTNDGFPVLDCGLPNS